MAQINNIEVNGEVYSIGGSGGSGGGGFTKYYGTVDTNTYTVTMTDEEGNEAPWDFSQCLEDYSSVANCVLFLKMG